MPPSNNRSRKNGNQKKAEDSTPKDVEINRERFLTVLKDMTGQHVTVQLKDGSKFNAIFHTVSTIKDKDFNYVFKAAKSKADGSKQYSGYSTKIVNSSEVVQISIASIVLKENQPGAGEFATDSEISGNSAAHLMNRDLTEVNNAWLDKDLEADSEMTAPAAGEKWDQFEANYKLTGKMATYDESMYTTSLDANKIDKKKAAEAEAIASAIENEAATGVSALHVATERGQKVDLKGMDEEDEFSGVVRAKEEEKPKTTKLDPKAKPFVFNPGAASFTPTFAPASPQKSTPPAPPPAVPLNSQYGGAPYIASGGAPYNPAVPFVPQTYGGYQNQGKGGKGNGYTVPYQQPAPYQTAYYPGASYPQQGYAMYSPGPGYVAPYMPMGGYVEGGDYSDYGAAQGGVDPKNNRGGKGKKGKGGKGNTTPANQPEETTASTPAPTEG